MLGVSIIKSLLDELFEVSLVYKEECNGQHTDTVDATALSAKSPHSLHMSSDSYILVSYCEPYNQWVRAGSSKQ
jgi:hypothetical protein